MEAFSLFYHLTVVNVTVDSFSVKAVIVLLHAPSPLSYFLFMIISETHLGSNIREWLLVIAVSESLALRSGKNKPEAVRKLKKLK